MQVEIRNNKNIIIGWCRDDRDVITALHIKYGYQGRYVKSSNITFDKNGRLYCYGDGTSSLIREADTK